MAIEFKDGKYVDPKTGHVTLDPTIYKDWQIAEEAEAVLDRVLIAFLLALGVLLIGWGGSFTLLLVALWLLAKEKEGKKGRNRSCQGLQKRVKWFLHSK